jgi:predicted ATPase
VERLTDHLRERHVLLVLDNFEQVLPAAPIVSELLHACPNLKVMVTSRAPLRLYGEREFPVLPLALPDPRRLPDLPSLSQYEAVRLFIDRAVSVRPDFMITNENAPAVAEICARLDGLPLAIELAAARARLLTPQAMLTRLGSRLTLVAGGARDVPARQQTLREAINWSYELLEPAERRLLARLGVFVGGWQLDEAEAVCGAGDDIGIDLLDGLSSLAEKSLITAAQDQTGEPRFAMLETIREFALERLEEGGEATELRRRHAAAYLRLAMLAAPELIRPSRPHWLERLEREHGNLRAALGWAIDQGEALLALRFVASLWRFWQMRGHLREGRQWAENALALPNADRFSVDRLAALEAAGGIAHWTGDIDGQHAYYGQALELALQLNEPRHVAEASYNVGFPFLLSGEVDAAETYFRKSLRGFQALGDRHGIGRVRWALAVVALVRGQGEEAQREAQEALETFGAVDDVFMAGWSLYLLGDAARRSGDHATARERWKEGLTIGAQAGDLTAIVFILDHLALEAAMGGDPERAVRLIAASRAMRAKSGTNVKDLVLDEKELAPYLDTLSEQAAEAALAEGQAMDIEAAVAYALEGAGPSQHGAPTG